MKTPKLSFKKNPRETGLAGVANHTPSTQIKADKYEMGTIDPPNYRRFGPEEPNWTIRIQVMKNESEITKEPNCPWKWVTFKARFETEELAREWLKVKWEVINKQFQIKKEG